MAAPLQAGELVNLTNTAESNGKLSLSASSIHVDGAAPLDVNLPDVLEANFSDAPFQLQYFDSASGSLNQLPPDWTAKPIEANSAPGSAFFSHGALTVTGDGVSVELHPDHYFFAGMPWNGDGQWTAHLKELTPAVSDHEPSTTVVAMTLRGGLNAGDSMFGIGVNGNGDESLLYGRGGYRGQPGKFPLWLRLTRTGNSLDSVYLNDDKVWESISEDNVPLPTATWIGFMVNSFAKGMGSALIEDISFTPDPAQPEVVRPGILLKSGTFLASDTFHLTSTDGRITHDNKDIVLKTDQVAAAVYHPVTMRQLAAADSQQGLIMINGDFLASDIQSVDGAAGGGGMVQMNSIPLGPVAYYGNMICACATNPMHPLPSDYEIRLRDGSIIRAKSLDLAGGTLTIQEVGGIAIPIDPAEIAQIRAGLNRVQPLIDLPWKTSGVSVAKTISLASSVPAAGTTRDNKAAAEPMPPPAATTPQPDIAKWMGPNREQILVVPAGAKIEIPLVGKFNALAMRLALAPGSPAGAQVSLHLLVAGAEVGSTPKIKAGEQPISLRIPISDPKSVTLTIDNAGAGTRLLLIDPIAVREEVAAAQPASSPSVASSHAQASSLSGNDLVQSKN